MPTVVYPFFFFFNLLVTVDPHILAKKNSNFRSYIWELHECLCLDHKDALTGETQMMQRNDLLHNVAGGFGFKTYYLQKISISLPLES
jgi:hypothetical protein